MRSVPLSEFMVSRGGSVSPDKFPDESFELYSIPSYSSRKPELLKGKEIGSSKKSILPGDVLLSRIVPHIRRAWVVGTASESRQIASGEWIIFRGSSFAPNYLRHYLLADRFHQQFMRTVSGVGGSLLRARPAEVEKIKIPLPPLEEQKRIAEILDKADAIRKKRKQSIELTEQFLRSAFLDMFGDPITNPKGWPTETIGKLLESGQLIVHKDGNYGGMYPRADEFGDSGIPFLTAKSVDKNGLLIQNKVSYLNEDKANTFNYGWIEKWDVLLAHNATVGRVMLYHGDYAKALIGTSLTCFRSSRDFFDSRFLFAMLRSDYFQRQLEKAMSQSTRNQVPITAQREMELFIPPLAFQKKFGNLLQKAYENHQHLVNSEAHKKLLINSLVGRAFRGVL